MAVGDQPTTAASLQTTLARIEATLARSKAVSQGADELNAKWTHYKDMMEEMNATMMSKLREKLGKGTAPLREAVVVPVETMAQVLHRSKKVVVLTGAGISVESGIPAYRTADGCWTVGSVNYRPTETATFKHFNEHPEEHWRRLHEKWTTRGWKAGDAVAQPNAGHLALVELERLCASRGSFHLLTQNIDGLHLDAGSSPATTFQVHGSMRLMRCDESQPGSCASESGLLRRTAAFLKAEHGSLRAAFARFAEGERLTEAALARGLAASVSGVDARAVAMWIAGVFAAVRVKGVLENSEEEYATLASFCSLGEAVFPIFGGEWSAERIAADPVPRCPRCSCRCRPEVLWFDECYDETHFRADSAKEAAAAADCLLVVGTTLTTGLPSKVVRMAHERGVPVLNVDPGCLAEPRKGMLNLPRGAGAALPELAAALRSLQAEPAPPPPRSPAPAAKKRAVAAVSSTRQAAKSSRANGVALPGALAARRPSDSSRASTPEAPERVFLCGADAPWGEGAPALLRGASLYARTGGDLSLVLEETAMAVRGVLAAADSVPAGSGARSLVAVDLLDPADPSRTCGQEHAWAYHLPAAPASRGVDRKKAAVVPDGDARSWRPA